MQLAAKETQRKHELELETLPLQQRGEAGNDQTQPMPAAPLRVTPKDFTPYKDREDPEVFLSNFEKQAN